jgi:tetratricopeptide (TPR) repeat protein
VTAPSGRRGGWRRAGRPFLVLALAACAPLAPRPPTLAVERPALAVPFHAQREHACGPAALAMLLGARGVSVDPDALTPQLVVPGREGSFQPELLAAARAAGFIAQPIAPTLEALGAELAAGRPVLVLQNLGLSWLPRWHYAVAIGYDARHDELILHSGTDAARTASRRRFDSTWARGGRWGFVLLAPGELPTGADAAAHARAIAAFEARAADPAAARRAWQAARARWPERWELALGLGGRLAADGATAAAIDELQAAVALDPGQAVAWNNLASALMDAGRWDEALAAAERAAALAPLPAVQATLREAGCRRAPGCSGE